jgi:hypothetical protein
MEAHPRMNDYRKVQRRREFGLNPVCVMCGETDPVVFHHLAGEANDCWIEGPHCLNCHAREHDALRHLGVDLRHQPRTLLERLEAVLRGLAVFFRQLSDRLAEWASMLAAFIRALNERFPDWRELKEAW